MLELDAWLGAFLDTAFGDLDRDEQAEFGRLLEQEDMDLYAWLSGQLPPPAEFRSVIEMIRKVTSR
ncbi:MAG: succinate dehydrogenase assembly factor 2 [Hydrogenophilaceae bacterium]|nr:succinate dehydrogenase assembly factor 2 [Hydrogenophilaceae bacterium]